LNAVDLFPGYCIDTSALIDLWRRKYPPDVFRSLWGSFENLINQGLIAAPKEVLRELEKRDDELLRWAKQHHSIFIDFDTNQERELKLILAKFPDMVDYLSDSPQADPFIVALAKSIDWLVVSSESPGINKIPTVCAAFGIKCIQLLEFFREQNWSF